MQPGEKIRNLRFKRGLTQKKLAEMAGLKQGYISNVETGRQMPSSELIRKISPIIGASKDDIVEMLGAMPKDDVIWPDIVSENQCGDYEINPRPGERRLQKNIPKRRLIDNVIKILDSGNKKVIKTLLADIDFFMYTLKPAEAEIEEDE